MIQASLCPFLSASKVCVLPFSMGRVVTQGCGFRDSTEPLVEETGRCLLTLVPAMSSNPTGSEARGGGDI